MQFCVAEGLRDKVIIVNRLGNDFSVLSGMMMDQCQYEPEPYVNAALTLLLTYSQNKTLQILMIIKI